MALSDTLQQLIQAGVQVAAYSTSVANSGTSTADTLKNQLYANSAKIQSLINYNNNRKIEKYHDEKQ